MGHEKKAQKSPIMSNSLFPIDQRGILYVTSTVNINASTIITNEWKASIVNDSRGNKSAGFKITLPDKPCEYSLVAGYLNVSVFYEITFNYSSMAVVTYTRFGC